MPQSWFDKAMAKGVPAAQMTSSFDIYLAGYVWDQPVVQLSKTAVFSGLPGISKYFIADSLINALIPAALLLVTIYYFYIRKGFLKKRAKAKGGATMGFSDELAGIWTMITASKRTTIMGDHYRHRRRPPHLCHERDADSGSGSATSESS